MKILNEIKHKYLGNICCIADEDGNPFEWNKFESISIFNRNYENIKISFNFFCFNMYFEVNEVFEDIAENVNKSIVKYYKLFFDDKKEIEEIFLGWFKRDVECKLENKVTMGNNEDICKLIKIRNYSAIAIYFIFDIILGITNRGINLLNTPDIS